MNNMKNNAANNIALITEYDMQIASLIRERDRLVYERDNLTRNNDENVECYDSTIRAKNELESVLNNIADYARTNRQNIDSRVKLLRNMYDFLEQSTTQSKMQQQIEELNQATRSVRDAVDEMDGEIDYLNIQIGNVEREIERIKGLRGAIDNG